MNVFLVLLDPNQSGPYTDCKNCYPNLVPMDVVDDGGNEIHIEFIWETWAQVLQSVLAVFSYTGMYIVNLSHVP